MCNRVQGPPDLCATVCNYESGLCATNWPPSCWPAFPSLSLPPSHPRLPTKLPGALWLRSFSSSSFVTLLGGLRSVTGPPPTPHGWLLRQCCAIAAVFALAGWLAFLGTLQSNRQQLLYVLLCYFFSFFVWAFLSPFFCVFLTFWIRFCMVHPDLFSQLFCTLHLHKSHSGELGIVHKKLTSDVIVKWGHCFILWHATRIAWITRQIYCLKALPLAHIQKKRSSSKLILGSE